MPKVKNPADLVRKVKDALGRADSGNKKSVDEVTKQMTLLKTILFGEENDAFAQVCQEIYSSGLLLVMVNSLERVDFEGKKDIVQTFTKVVRREVGTRTPTVDHICSNSDLLFILVDGYEKPDIALQSGQMLRECIKFEPLAKIILNKDEVFNKFFTYVQLATFDLAADAFSTFKDLLTKHKILCADFLEKNYDLVFGRYVELLNSENYVTRRQSLKLLGELLLDRANFTIMTKYISNPENLKLMMNMLRDQSTNIQFEAFHVFKVFVANPNKSGDIMQILLRNKDKLIDFLGKFHEHRTEDDQFSDEKQYLIKQIKDLK